jgi:hypothetical protein
MPWDGVDTGNGDEIEVDIEGELGVFGRQNKTLPVNTGPSQWSGYLLDLFIPNNVPDGPASLLLTEAGTYNFQTFIQRAADTTQARLSDGVKIPSGDADIYFTNSSDTPYATVKFSDTTNNSTNRTYFEIDFDGLADDYFTIITVQPDEVVAQTVDTGGEDRNYEVLTLNASTEAAADLARYLGAKFGSPTITPSRIAARTGGQQTQNLDTLGASNLELGYLVKYRIQIDFRGHTFYAQLEGVELSANLSETTYTYYLSPDDGVGWFTLDSATLGVLDEDRLGFI